MHGAACLSERGRGFEAGLVELSLAIMNNNYSSIANLVTLSRVLLAFVVYILLLYSADRYVYWAFCLTALVFIGDYLDGFLARSLKQTSKLGAWFDIAADRLIEICYWIVLSCVGVVSVWVAIIFVVRGEMVGGIRSLAAQEGFSAFGGQQQQQSMMKSRLSYFLVASPFSRFSYALCKVIAFSLLILSINHQQLKPVADVFTIAAVLFCLLRGVPVIYEGLGFWEGDRPQK